MNAEDMPIANKDNLNQDDCNKQRSKGNSSSQKGNFGIDDMDGGVIQDNAKVAGVINEFHQKKNVKASVKQGDTEYSFEASTVEEVIKGMKCLKQLFNVEVEDIEQGSIKFILKGSEEGLENIATSFRSGKLAPLLKQQFNLELEDAKLIDSDSSENYPNNQTQKLLAFTIAGNFTQADIDILKTALINTSDDDAKIETDENQKSRLIEEIVNQGAKGKDLSNANLSAAHLSAAHLRGANLSATNLSAANLSAADLSAADLSAANLSAANLILADLSDADLRGANLSAADLSGANLRATNLSGANLNDANLRGANLRATNLSAADLRDADLRVTDLRDANLRVTDLSAANLRDADLRDADLRDANLSGAMVEKARFGNNKGISESQKQDLIAQGAIFEDIPGDHVFSRR